LSSLPRIRLISEWPVEGSLFLAEIPEEFADYTTIMLPDYSKVRQYQDEVFHPMRRFQRIIDSDECPVFEEQPEPTQKTY
jgi:hypothetical protein